MATAIETLRAAGFSLLSPIALRWLTVRDIAAQLDVHPITVRRLIDSGDLAPVLRWGNEIRVSERALAAWVERHTR